MAIYVNGLSNLNQYLKVQILFEMANPNMGIDFSDEVFFSGYSTKYDDNLGYLVDKVLFEGQIGVGVDNNSPKVKRNK